MSHKTVSVALCLLMVALTAASSGCFTARGPNLGLAGIPIPVSPYQQDDKEDQWWVDKRYARAPILGPLEAGGPDQGLDPPSDDEVMHALERARPVEGGMPFLYEVQRNNVRIVKDKIADYIDPPRVVPLIGPAQLHHVHYKVTIYFDEITRVGWPIPHTLYNEDAQEVIYMDKNHFHMVGNVDTGVNANY